MTFFCGFSELSFSNLQIPDVSRICISDLYFGSVFLGCISDLYFSDVSRNCISDLYFSDVSRNYSSRMWSDGKFLGSVLQPRIDLGLIKSQRTICTWPIRFWHVESKLVNITWIWQRIRSEKCFFWHQVRSENFDIREIDIRACRSENFSSRLDPRKFLDCRSENLFSETCRSEKYCRSEKLL